MRQRTTLQITSILVLIVASFSSEICSGQETINPLFENWSQFDIGTQVTMSTVAENRGTKVSEMKMTHKLIHKSDELVRVEMQSFVVAGGREVKGANTKMEFKKLLTPAEAKLQKQAEQKAKSSSGTERLSIAGKTYSAKWTLTEIETAMGKTTSKIWMSPKFPGMTLKSETKMANGMVSTTEVTRLAAK